MQHQSDIDRFLSWLEHDAGTGRAAYKPDPVLGSYPSSFSVWVRYNFASHRELRAFAAQLVMAAARLMKRV